MKTLTLALFSLMLGTQLFAMDNFFWLTQFETSQQFPGDISRFFGRDTLWGPVHSNDWIATQNVGGLPTSYVRVTTSKPNFRAGSPNPAMHFLGGAPVFNAREIPFPASLIYLRQTAQAQNQFLIVEGHEWYGSVNGDQVRFYHYPEGTARDTTTDEFVDLALNSFRTVIFVDGRLDLRGVLAVQGCQLLLGCSQDIRLVDNLMIEGTNTTNGSLPAGVTSRIAIASEHNIVVANTWENGRENKTGTPPNNRDIVVTGYIFAIGGSFQFEQMNDVNDPYISPTNPDERGNLVMTGGITQYYRGYVHRSNRGGTGYNKVYHYDERNRRWRTGVFEPIDPFEEDVISSDVSDPLFPKRFMLNVAPNPFNASTTIRFTLPSAGMVRARVFDVQGREVMQLVDQQYAAGSHVLQFDGAALSSGVYFLSFQSADNVSTHKLLLLK